MAQDLCKYYKKQRFVSYNDGLTWQPLEEYEKGELYETHSASCGAGVFQYRWVLVDNAYICDGKDRYAREVYQYSEDGTVWYNTFPTQYRKGYLVESNSPFCDNAGNGQYTSGDTEPVTGDTIPCPPNYEWNGYECVCMGEMLNGDCIVCDRARHLVWSSSQQMCVCGPGYGLRRGVCVAMDPLKTIKCSNSNGILTSADTQYYSSGWAAISYTVGDCITKIETNAFNGQILLADVTIPNTVNEVGNLAFANCRSLETILFPNNITTLGVSVFLRCSNLKNVTFEGTIPSEVPTGLFSQCEKLETATWLQYNNITSIGIKSFYNCYSLNNVTLPDTLQTIGNQAFYGNRSMTNITIPSGVTSIGTSAFENCTAMTFVNINSDEVSIGDSAFKGNTSLTAVTINSSGLTIGNDVFSGCTRLLKLTFTATVPPQIEEGDFDNTNECAIFVPCGSLEAYKTAWSQYADRISCNDTGVYYRWVDDDGFYCDGTDEYTRQKQQSTTNGITWTDTGVYRPITLITHYSKKCGYIGDVTLTVTSDDGTIRYYVPCDSEPPKPSENSKIFATYAYGNNSEKLCDGSTTLTSGETRMSGSNYSYSTMESAVVGNCVTSIGANCFIYCTKLRNITIPNSVTTIGSSAFYCCDSLSSVTIPNSVTNIGSYAFQGCSGLTSATIGNSVTTIGEFAFNDCSSLTSVTIPNSVTNIGSYAFQGCSSLQSITIQRTTPPSIGNNYVFSDTNDCPIYVPEESVEAYKTARNWSNYASRIKAIPVNKFEATYTDGTSFSAACDDDSSLTTATTRTAPASTMKTAVVGNCVTTIGDGAFRDCSILRSVTIPNSVTSIGSSAFTDCRSLASVEIPDSVTSIGDWSFGKCGLTSVTIPNSVTIIPSYAFGFCKSLTSIVIPNSVITIGQWAFDNCRSLTSVTIPNSVTSISDYAFFNASLTSVTIGSSVTSIGVQTFAYCSSLTSITINATTPPLLGGDAFQDTNNCPIYVPSESVDAYKAAATHWNDYADRIQAIPNN